MGGMLDLQGKIDLTRSVNAVYLMVPPHAYGDGQFSDATNR